MLSAVYAGDVKRLAELIRQDRRLDVKMDQDEHGATLLHHACWEDISSPMIPILLAHPGIDVNVKDKSGWTPFFGACRNGNTSCVREMLKDSRLKVNEPGIDGCTPLWWAAADGHLDSIKWWVASGREVDLGEPENEKKDVILAAKTFRNSEVVILLERFKEHPEDTRHAMRVELGLLDKLAAEMFALVIFVSDGLLQAKDTATTPSPAARFFSIARTLPLELQMVLCYRAVGSGKEIIPGKDSEAAFLVWSSIFTS